MTSLVCTVHVFLASLALAVPCPTVARSPAQHIHLLFYLCLVYAPRERLSVESHFVLLARPQCVARLSRSAVIYIVEEHALCVG